MGKYIKKIKLTRKKIIEIFGIDDEVFEVLKVWRDKDNRIIEAYYLNFGTEGFLNFDYDEDSLERVRLIDFHVLTDYGRRELKKNNIIVEYE
jgi:hypothetical protein